MTEQGKEDLQLEALRQRELRSEKLRFAKADGHIAVMEEQIRHHRERIERWKAQGLQIGTYQAMLSTMLETLYVMRGHRTVILERIDRLTQFIRA